AAGPPEPGRAPPARPAGHPAGATAAGASVKTPDLDHLVIGPARFHGQALRRVRLPLLKALGRFLQYRVAYSDLPVSDPPAPAGIRGWRGAQGLFIDPAGPVPVPRPLGGILLDRALRWLRAECWWW